MTTRTPHVHAEVIKAFADGENIQFKEYGLWLDWEHACVPAFFPEREYRIKPEREYPVTSLTDDELMKILMKIHEDLHRLNIPFTIFDRLRYIANAAIKRYIDDMEKS